MKDTRLRLSAEGKKVALGIIRRHRLWEFFSFRETEIQLG
jgi:Mn-dependent DtxR family transcriptional regulator